MTAKVPGLYDPDAAAAAAAAQQYQEMQLDPFDFDKPRGLQGLGESTKSLMAPSAEAGRSLMMAGAPVAMAIDKALQAGDRLGGRTARREEFGLGEKDYGVTDWYFRNVVDELGSDAVESWRPNVGAMGSTARALSTVNTVVGSVPQMIGMPGVFLGNSALSPATDLVREGVDVKTAATVGGVNLAVNAIGMKLPAAWGADLATRVGTGAGANLATGIAGDVASAGVLKAGGYEKQSTRYDPADPFARGLDFLMGAAFGVKAHVDAPRLTPTQRDAAMVANNATHFRQDSMPGTPARTGADLRHQTAMATALNQAMAGEPISVNAVLQTGDFELAPRLDDALRAAETPAALAVPPAGTSGFSSGYDAYRRALESGGRADARNPNSSATGADQFTAATWRRIVARTKPAWAEGLADGELLATRLDPLKSGEMARALDADNAAALRAAGLPASDHNLYAAHHFGINKGKAFARAADSTPMELILSKDQLEANPYLRGRSKGEALANWDERARRAGAAPGKPVETSAAALPDTAPRRPDLPAVTNEGQAPRPTVEQLRSGADLFPEPPPRASRAEFDAWTEGRLRAALPETVTALHEELTAARSAAQDSAALAQDAPADATRAQAAQDATQHVEALERRLTAAEAGRVKLPESDAQRRAYEDWQTRESVPRHITDAADQDRSRVAHVDAQVREVLQRVGTTPDGAVLAPGIRARREGDGYRVTVDADAAGALRQTLVAPPDGRLPSRDELAAAVRTAAEELDVRVTTTGAATTDPIAAARTVAQLDPDLRVPTGEVDADGNTVFRTASEAMADAEQGIRDAELDAQALHAAANCFLRMGA